MQASETSKPGRFASIVVDTDVWLDYYLGFREGNRDACELLAAANRAGVNLLCAVTTIKDQFYLTAADFKRDRRSRHGGQLNEEGVAASHATAWACLKNLKNHGPIGIAAVLPLPGVAFRAPGKPHVLLRWADLCCAICGASEAFYVHESPHVSVYAARR